MNRKRNFSSFSLKKDNNLDKFYQWFVGFSDAESNFSINPKLDKNGLNINRFSFAFLIGLHIDELSVLEYIKNKLEIGNITVTNKECKFSVTDKEGIKKLISIFDKYNLNTSKYLDYSDFKKAYVLYYGREKIITEKLKNEILKLKDNMNLKRTNFNMPSNHKIIITENWLIGLIEGEGSFQLWRNDITPVFLLFEQKNNFLF